MPNQLINETSPYLLQHAHNPVDWYPWGLEAFERARAENKPLMLSVGYSSCHWCHVMEHESFEDPAIAALMNELFINIKVDREERPDVDAIYMEAVQAMTNHGGWPMTVFLTPDGKPFFGGTYFPPADRAGMSGFPRVLRSVADAFHNRRNEVAESAKQLAEMLNQHLIDRVETTQLSEQVINASFSGLEGQFDWAMGGIKGAPKFPIPMIIDYLLRFYKRTGQRKALEMATITLDRMARGGMYDQIGGGFHRYSVDDQWLVPHFEKMLYDNAQLALSYVQAFQVTSDPRYRKVAEETLDYVLREMTDPAGGFYSSQDADTEGEEGTTYVWDLHEVRTVLGPELSDPVQRYFGITGPGNFEGHNILWIPRAPEKVAKELKISDEALEDYIRVAREKLYSVREKRPQPGRDDKVIAAWNGLTLKAFAVAATVLKRDDYREAAVANAEFLMGSMWKDDVLMRIYKDGRAKIHGFLEDYACCADGLLAVYEATFDTRWFAAARELSEQMVAKFRDESDKGFFDTSTDHERLISRPKNIFDNATPSGNAVACEVLMKLSLYTAEFGFAQVALDYLERTVQLPLRYPNGFGRTLCAIELALASPVEVAIVGDPESQDAKALFDVVFDEYQPNRVVAARPPGDEAAAQLIPLLEGRDMVGGKPTAHVCQRHVCKLPVTSANDLRSQLSELAN